MESWVKVWIFSSNTTSTTTRGVLPPSIFFFFLLKPVVKGWKRDEKTKDILCQLRESAHFHSTLNVETSGTIFGSHSINSILSLSFFPSFLLPLFLSTDFCPDAALLCPANA